MIGILLCIIWMNHWNYCIIMIFSALPVYLAASRRHACTSSLLKESKSNANDQILMIISTIEICKLVMSSKFPSFYSFSTNLRAIVTLQVRVTNALCLMMLLLKRKLNNTNKNLFGFLNFNP